jgi:PBP1b-binding outer membrane lipoprotein LpoB
MKKSQIKTGIVLIVLEMLVKQALNMLPNKLRYINLFKLLSIIVLILFLTSCAQWVNSGGTTKGVSETSTNCNRYAQSVVSTMPSCIAVCTWAENLEMAINLINNATVFRECMHKNGFYKKILKKNKKTNE